MRVCQKYVYLTIPMELHERTAPKMQIIDSLKLYKLFFFATFETKSEVQNLALVNY